MSHVTPEVMTFPRTHQGVRDLDQVEGKVLPFSGGPAAGTAGSGAGGGSAAPLLFAAGGAALILIGLARGTALGLGLALAGGLLTYRGLAGPRGGRGATKGGPGPGTSAEPRPEIAYRIR